MLYVFMCVSSIFEISNENTDFRVVIVDNRFMIFSVPFDKMNEYYNASDFAILLRDHKRLNLGSIV